MVAQPSEASEDRGRSDLIRDIGRIVRSPGTPVTSEQHLMRLSDDPLLVRDFIHRLDPAGPLARRMPPMRSEAALVLAGTTASQIGSGPTGETGKNQRYEATPLRDEGSVFPFAFRPTADDRKSALLHCDHPATGLGQRGKGLVPAAAIFIMVIIILMILIFQD